MKYDDFCKTLQGLMKGGIVGQGDCVLLEDEDGTLYEVSEVVVGLFARVYIRVKDPHEVEQLKGLL